MDEDVTPQGDPINVHTTWLPFEDGQDIPLTVDLTQWDAAMRKLHQTLDEHQ